MATAVTDAQRDVIDSGILWGGFNCLLQMPTGSGKTWLAQQAIMRTVQAGRRAVYLTPLRALADELYTRWKDGSLQGQVGVFTGDYSGATKPPPVSFQRARGLIMTPERLDACTRNWRTHWSWIPEVDLLVIDEFHLLGEGNRGPRLEGALLRMMRLNPFMRVLGLSATMGNRQELARWLGGVEYASEWRSVPLKWEVLRFRKAIDKPALLVSTVRKCVEQGGKSLVFVQSRRRAEQLAGFLTQEGLVASHHHAGLAGEQRSATERQLRDGHLQALVATGTLEMGLNLPVRQVVLYDMQGFNGTEFEPLTVSRVWQRGGRAGRPGLDPQGEVVLLVPAWEKDLERYLRGEFEPIRSSLTTPVSMAEQVIVEVSSGLSRTVEQLRRAMSASLSSWQGRPGDVPGVVHDMLEGGMLTIERGNSDQPSRETLKATRLGRIASRQQLAPGTIMHMRHLVDAHGDDLTLFDLLLTAISSHDCELLLPVGFEELDWLASALGAERSAILQADNRAVVDRLKTDSRRLLAVLKTALASRAWTRSGNADEVADDFDCYPSEMLRLREALIRLLTALAAIVDDAPAEANDNCEDLWDAYVPASLAERCSALLAMVAGGVDEETVTLTLVSGLGAVLARRLREAGISSIEDLALAEAEEVSRVRGISIVRAGRLVEEAQRLVKTRSARQFSESGPRLAVPPPGWPESIDPYRLRRSLDLEVEDCPDGLHVVKGGLEPHVLRVHDDAEWDCDCVDSAKGNTCKHILAVRLHHHEDAVQGLVERLGREHDDAEALDLFGLWFSDQRGIELR